MNAKITIIKDEAEDEDCNHRTLLTKILDKLCGELGEDEIAFTVCYDCRTGDFCHVETSGPNHVEECES